jgi:peptidoglycan/LPS O-acetylase OafA/YrhL
MPNSSRQFNNAVHALRALAVLMVFAVHLLDSFSTYFFPACEALNAAMPFIKRFGTFGVELFFVISGFVIMNSVRKYGLREFLLRRLIRIYPLFAFFTVAFLVLSWITNVHSGSTVETAFLNLTFLNIYFGTPALSPNAWSLTFEANFYIFAGVACFVLRERLIGVIILLLFGMTAFLIMFPIATYFVVGCLLYAARELQPSSLPRSLQIAVLAVWCALAATIDHETMSGLSVVLIAASAILFFVVTVPNGIHQMDFVCRNDQLFDVPCASLCIFPIASAVPKDVARQFGYWRGRCDLFPNHSRGCARRFLRCLPAVGSGSLPCRVWRIDFQESS